MLDRASGILLHPTSLPALGGIGDLGPAAHNFVEFLAAARQRLWQLLPLSPVGYGNSPYSSTSAFAGNPLLISLQRLADRGWIDPGRLSGLSVAGDKVDYPRVQAVKLPLLIDAASTFLREASGADRARFEPVLPRPSLVARRLRCLRRFAPALSLPKLESLARQVCPQRHCCPGPSARGSSDSARHRAGYPVCLLRTMACLASPLRPPPRSGSRRRCHFRELRQRRRLDPSRSFRLNDSLEPEVVAGVPPDVFSATGQRWGNPLYRWEILQARGFDWWVQRMRQHAGHL